MNIMALDTNWPPLGVLSAVFAELTAIFAKVGLEGIDWLGVTLVAAGWSCSH